MIRITYLLYSTKLDTVHYFLHLLHIPYMCIRYDIMVLLKLDHQIC